MLVSGIANEDSSESAPYKQVGNRLNKWKDVRNVLQHFLDGLKVGIFTARADQRVLVDCLEALEIFESCQRAVRA